MHRTDDNFSFSIERHVMRQQMIEEFDIRASMIEPPPAYLDGRRAAQHGEPFTPPDPFVAGGFAATCAWIEGFLSVDDDAMRRG